MPYRPYVIRQGDYLSRLAAEHGFSAREVWEAPENAELRQRRASMDILCPGDVVHLPTTPAPTRSISAGTTNRYRAALRTVRVELVLQSRGQPLANEPYVISGAGPERQGTTDGDGRLRAEVPITVREVTAVFPRQRLAFPLHVGGLDPANEMSGVRQRLANLGLWGRRGGDGDGSEDARAIRAFQAAHGLPVTGHVDDATRARLVEKHGS